MPVDQRSLLSDLQRQVRALEDDVRDRAAGDAEVSQRLQDEHAEARRVGRTATSFGEWRDTQVTQAAVAWVLATVFVRFCEDNGLVDEPWIAGPGERLRQATERQQHHLVTHGDQNDRDWLLAAFDHLASYPAVSALFDHRHNPLYRLEVSADAAEELIGFWRRRDEAGVLLHDFTDHDLGTRFLGDLYQDLSEAARKQYALLQTPDFVEELILDLTLDPAVETFGLDVLKMIDPTCGSGHFLLGAFDRLLDAWTKQSPGVPIRERVANVLDSIHGVDVNPFASAIARFRLTVAAMRAEGTRRLAEAPGHTLHIGTGDSLLHGKAEVGDLFDSALGNHVYASEDLDEHPEILKRGRYHVVVGNPPYITVKDKALNEAYRTAYTTCYRKYHLSAPFTELMFMLAQSSTSRPGYVGLIIDDAFKTREYGKPLIEDFLSQKDLTRIIDTSGIDLPGHGTPTIILFGHNRLASSAHVRTVQCVKGQGQSDRPEAGPAWTSIVENRDKVGHDDAYISVRELDRARLAAHPWDLAPGSAGELVRIASGATARTIGDRLYRVGFFGIMGADDAMVYEIGQRRHPHGLSETSLKRCISGEAVRDWRARADEPALFPYAQDHAPIALDDASVRFLWPMRRLLQGRETFAGVRYEEAGQNWYGWHQLPVDEHAHPWTIAWGEVATHNHFLVSTDDRIFRRTAPIIKLHGSASRDDHFALVAFLNSSLAAFMLRARCYPKGRGEEPWADRYAFNATNVAQLPFVDGTSRSRASLIDTRVAEWVLSNPESLLQEQLADRRSLANEQRLSEEKRALCIGTQEELDWEVYAEYGLLDEDLFMPVGSEPQVRLGERAFEIVLARSVAVGEVETAWFERHRSTPVTEVPPHWPEEYRKLVERRIELIETHPHLKLLERPEFKRRWAEDPWEVKQERALRGLLLDRLEDEQLWRSDGFAATQSVAQLAGKIAADATFLEVLELWAGRTVADPAKELARLLADEHVPYLAAHRYKPNGLRKRAEWESTWDLQRREDAGESVDVPVPPKYTTADFAKTSYWKHRGKLDVPKERFISYPGAERGADTSLVLGWAGWNHAEQSQALAVMVDDRQRREGWEADRLIPLLAGLAELEPWLHQWHADVDARIGQSPAHAITGLVEQQLGRLQLTRDDLSAWRPPAPTRGRRARS